MKFEGYTENRNFLLV